MNVLVTGAAGRIGQAVIDELLPRGHGMRGIDVQPPPRSDIGRLAAVIRDLSQVEQACAGVDAVIHLAAIPGPGPRDRRDGWLEIVHRNIQLGTPRIKDLDWFLDGGGTFTCRKAMRELGYDPRF